MLFIPKPHEIYRHFKGNLYQITAIAEHSETGEQLVVYQALYDDFKTYARPLSMFVSRVDRTKYPDAEQEFRFELQGPDAGRQRAESEPEQGAEAPEQNAVIPDLKVLEQNAVIPDLKVPEQKTTISESGLTAQEPEETVIRDEGDEEWTLDPMVLEFLDSDSYEQRLNILAGLHHRITNDMITTMAISCDIEINDGDVEERYESLKTCLLTLERYECNRMR